MVGRAVAAIGEFSVALIVGAVAVPVAWLVVRVIGLVPLMTLATGGLTRLMFAGGALFGAIAGMGAVAAVLSTLDEADRLGPVLGAIGGAIGGVCSSVMFFPIVVIL